MSRRRLPYAPRPTLEGAVLFAGEIAYDVTEERLVAGDGVRAGGRRVAMLDEILIQRNADPVRNHGIVCAPLENDTPTGFIDNVLGVQNVSIGEVAGSPGRGNAAFNFLDSLGHERGAMGYSRNSAHAPNHGYYPNIMYIECGNPFTTDAQASSFRLIVTHKEGGPYWNGQAVSYFPISLDSSNGDLRFSSNGGVGGGAITFDDATYFGSKGTPEIVGFGMSTTLARFRERGAANQWAITTNISDPQNGTAPTPDDVTKSMWQVEFGAGRDIFAVGRYAPGLNQIIVELFRADSNGRFMIGQTATAAGSDGQLCVTGAAGRSAATLKNIAGAAFPVLIGWNNATAGDNVFAQFGTEAAYTARGSIDYNRAGGQVRYNVTSDYRAKIDKGAVEDATERLLAIEVRRVRMLGGATEDVDGFIAHQLQAHAPYAVSGCKDQVDADGAPIFQQVDPSKVVPLAVASLQDAHRRLDRIETHVGLERLAA